MPQLGIGFHNNKNPHNFSIEPRVCLLTGHTTSGYMLKTTLENNGFSVQMAANKVGLDPLKDDAYDVIISDFVLPEYSIDSIRLLYAVRHGHYKLAENTPVVILVDRLSNRIVAKLKEAKASGVLAKPLDPVRLIAMIKEMLRRRGYQFNQQQGQASNSAQNLVSVATAATAGKRQSNTELAVIGQPVSDELSKTSQLPVVAQQTRMVASETKRDDQNETELEILVIPPEDNRTTGFVYRIIGKNTDFNNPQDYTATVSGAVNVYTANQKRKELKQRADYVLAEHRVAKDPINHSIANTKSNSADKVFDVDDDVIISMDDLLQRSAEQASVAEPVAERVVDEFAPEPIGYHDANKNDAPQLLPEWGIDESEWEQPTAKLWIVGVLAITIAVTLLSSMLSLSYEVEPYMEAKRVLYGDNSFWFSVSDNTAIGFTVRIHNENMFDLQSGACTACELIVPHVFEKPRQLRVYSDTGAEMAILNGLNADFFKLDNVQIAMGRTLLIRDIRVKTANAVIGAKISEALFAHDDPIGQSIQMGGHVLSVVGVLKAKDAGLLLKLGALPEYDVNWAVMVPYTYLQQRLGSQTIDNLQISTTATESKDKAVAQIIKLLLLRHPSGAAFETQSAQDWRNLAVAKAKGAIFIIAAVGIIFFVLSTVAIRKFVALLLVHRMTRHRLTLHSSLARIRLFVQVFISVLPLSALGGLLGVMAALSLNKAIEFWVNITVDTSWLLPLMAVGMALLIGFAAAVQALKHSGGLIKTA